MEEIILEVLSSSLTFEWSPPKPSVQKAAEPRATTPETRDISCRAVQGEGPPAQRTSLASVWQPWRAVPGLCAHSGVVDFVASA